MFGAGPTTSQPSSAKQIDSERSDDRQILDEEDALPA